MNRPAGAAQKQRAAARIPRSQDEEAASPPSLRRFGGSLLCAGLVLVAVGLEFASGQAANSAEDSHRLLLDERRNLGRYVIAALAATPFALFALGIAVGASWSTWH